MASNYIKRSEVLGSAEVECPMIYLNGFEVNACLDWNEYFYWLWFEISPSMLYLNDTPEWIKDINETEKELDEIAVLYCEDLDEANNYIRKYNADEDNRGFYDDECVGICSYF